MVGSVDGKAVGGNAIGFDDGCELKNWVGDSDGALQVDWKSKHVFVLLSNMPLHISREATLPHPSLSAPTDCDLEYIAGPRSSATFPSKLLTRIKGKDPSAANKAPPLPDDALFS